MVRSCRMSRGSWGLPEHCAVAAGGVDNACMAAGSGCVREGMGYTNLGTSAWIAGGRNKTRAGSQHKTIRVRCRPEGHVCIGRKASSRRGNTHRWVRNQICGDLLEAERNSGENSYNAMDRLAQTSPPGANGLIMTPTLAGGNLLDKSVRARGTITGLDLKHTRADVIRASMEGICLGLKVALSDLEAKIPLNDNMLIVGGGAKSEFWKTLFADIYEKTLPHPAWAKMRDRLERWRARRSASASGGITPPCWTLTARSAQLRPIRKMWHCIANCFSFIDRWRSSRAILRRERNKLGI